MKVVFPVKKLPLKGDYIVNSFLTNHEEGPRGMGGPENQISQTTQDDQVKDQVWGWKGDRDMRCMRGEMASERPSLTKKHTQKKTKKK